MLSVYRASAGSGKTYTLVRHYLEMAFDATDERTLRQRFGHILAITFTNKAAAEMKSRIMRELDKIIQGSSDHKDFDPAKAAIVKQSILHNYSDFAVTTIDSFMQRVVRTFAHDLNLPLNFDVELDNDEIVAAATDGLMSLIGREGEESMTKILTTLAADRMEEGKNYNLDDVLKRTCETLFREDSGQYLGQLKDYSADDFLRIGRQLKEENLEFERNAKELASKGVRLCAKLGIGDDSFPGKSKGLLGLLRGIADGKTANLAKRNGYWDKAIEDGSYAHKTAPLATAEALRQIAPQLTGIYEELMRIGEEELPIYKIKEEIRKRLYTTATMRRLWEMVQLYCEENDLIHISEFNKRINEEVCDNPSPFIYERLGSRYQNYLIDEFQDTSWMQWHNLAPLLRESVSQQLLGPSATNLESLVVGDGKQSIYRFRQGDVQQFIDLPCLRQDGQLVPLGTKESLHTLWTNYRSAAQIVRFNNTFFHWALKEPLRDNAKLREIYIGDDDGRELLHQDPSPQNDGGLVHLEFHDSADFDEVMTDRIHAIVDDLVGNHGYRQGDIMILTHRNRDLAAIARTLTGMTVGGEPVRIESSESYKLQASRTVLLLSTMLKWVASPDDRLLEAQAYELLKQCGKVQPGIAEFVLGGRRLADALRDIGIEIDPHTLGTMSLYDRCEAVVRLLNADIMEPKYVAAFLDAIHDYTLRHGQGAEGFAEWLEVKLPNLSCPADGQNDALRLMTIHKAKGLEAPVVILFLPKRKDMDGDIWVDLDKSLFHIPTCRVSCTKETVDIFGGVASQEAADRVMDEVNKLYVALTRPQQRLYVVAQTVFTSKGELSTHCDCGTAWLWDFAHALHSPRAGADPLMEIPAAAMTDDEGFLACEWGDKDSMPQPSPPTGGVEPELPPRGTAVLERLSMPGWQDRIRIALRRTSQGGDDEIGSETQLYGIQMHEVLSLITSASEVQDAVDVYARRHSMPDSGRAALAARIRAIVEHPVCAHFFAPGLKVRNECPMVYHGEVRRPDRVVELDGTTWVIDFKTGHPSPAAREKYHHQVGLYCDAMRKMGRASVRGVLLYIGNGDTPPLLEEV